MPAASPGGFLAVARQLRERLEAGEYEPGSDLPSARALASEFKVSPATVRRALRELDSMGLTAGRRGRPRMVLGRGAPTADSRAELVAGRLRWELFQGVRAKGDRLPAETELAAAFAVSRSTVREALRRLEEEGHVVQRSGRRYLAGDAERPDLLFERVADELRRTLEGAGFRRGVRLPAEAVLADEQGVSRPTVRKALALLRDEGLVRSEPKLGWFVVDAGERGTAR